MQIDDVVERIQKLLALAASDNPHEAALAASRAQDLMFQYHLDIDKIGPASTKRQDRIDFEMFYLMHQDKWRKVLINSICKFSFAKVIVICDSKALAGVVIIAREEDIANVKYLYLYLVEALERLCPEVRSSEGKHISEAQWEEGFYSGAVSAIHQTLEEQYLASQQVEGGTALVLRSNTAVKDKFEEMYPTAKTTYSHRKSMDGRAVEAGKREGSKIGIHRGIGHNPTGELNQ